MIMEINLSDCPACHKVHHGLKFYQEGANYWATCPFTGKRVKLTAETRRGVPGPSEVKHEQARD